MISAARVDLAAATLQVTASSIVSSGEMVDAGSTLTLAGTALTAASLTASASTYSMAGGSSLTVTQTALQSFSINLEDATSGFLVDGGGADGGTRVASMGLDFLCFGIGRLAVKTGQMDMLEGSVLRCPLYLDQNHQLDSFIPPVRRRLLQTDLSTTNPHATACGNSVYTVDVITGASLAVDTSCTFGTAAFDVQGTTSNYTVSFEAIGRVIVESGGVLVLNTISTASNVWSITGTFTLSGIMELLVTDTSSTGDVLLMKWDDTSCADITANTTIYGCTTCSMSVVALGSGTACYLRLTIGSTTSGSDSDNMLWLLLLLLLLPSCCLVP